MPALMELPSQVIHNDAHYGNLLCNPQFPEQVTGIIDFGDIIRGPLIVDLSVILSNVVGADPNVIKCAVAILEGYQKWLPIPQNQVELLYDALFARLALSAMLMTFRANHVQAPSQALIEYELPDAIQGLQHLLAIDQAEFTSAVLKQVS